jgi:hypothetical protein
MSHVDPIVVRFHYKDLADLIFDATEIVYCSPNVHPEVADALVEAQSRSGASVRVLLDPSEWAFRNGFGEKKWPGNPGHHLYGCPGLPGHFSVSVVRSVWPSQVRL